MKKFKLSEILRRSIGLGVLFAVSMSCFCGRETKEDSSNRIVPTVSTTPNQTKSPTASPTVGASPKPTEESMKTRSYRENLSSDFQMPSDSVGKRIVSEYGAVYVARGGATPPATWMFRDENECSAWQSRVSSSSETIGGINLELQTPAMKALQAAIAEARNAGEKITPRGADSARRSYSGTVELWASRVNPALEYWSGKGRLKPEEASRIKSLSPTEQVPEVLRLEEQGIYFSKDFSKSILYSVAAPGTSQHLSMLAFDVTEHDNAKVRQILARHGWFQTVVSDLPHFTYLGVAESELPKLGLKKTSNGGRDFWIPAL